MRFNGIKPVERTQTSFANIHEPSLTDVDPGLDRPFSELGTTVDRSEDRVPAIMVASVIGLAFGLVATDKLQDLRARLKTPKGEF